MVKPLVPPMVDILGPYTTTPQHVVSRPGKTGDAAGAGFSWWKDCTDENAEDGTPIPAVALNNYKAQLLTLFQVAGVAIDDVDEMLAYAVQSGGLNYAVATGTANAWTVATALAVPLYAAGRVLNIIAPATNTSTTVNMAVSGLGNRRIKKRNGNDPAIGDLIAGEVYPTIDDGTSIRILTPLPSDMVAASRVAAVQAFVAPSATNTVASSSTASKIVNFGTVTNNIADVATWASSRLTIVKSGWYQISVNLDSNMPLGTDYGYSFSVVRNGGSSIVGANGISRSTGVLGPFASASALYQLTAADYLEVFAAHNLGSSQNMPIRFTAKFEGV